MVSPQIITECPNGGTLPFPTIIKPIFFDKYYYKESDTRLSRGGGRVVREFSKPQLAPQQQPIAQHHYGLLESPPKRQTLSKTKSSDIELYGDEFTKSAPVLPKLEQQKDWKVKLKSLFGMSSNKSQTALNSMPSRVATNPILKRSEERSQTQQQLTLQASDGIYQRRFESPVKNYVKETPLQLVDKEKLLEANTPIKPAPIVQEEPLEQKMVRQDQQQQLALQEALKDKLESKRLQDIIDRQRAAIKSTKQLKPSNINPQITAAALLRQNAVNQAYASQNDNPSQRRVKFNDADLPPQRSFVRLQKIV